METLVVYSTCVFDETSREYVNCYYLRNRPENKSAINNLVKYKRFADASRPVSRSNQCFYYFVNEATNNLYNSSTFGDLVTILIAKGFYPNNGVLKVIKAQETNACLVLSTKLNER